VPYLSTDAYAVPFLLAGESVGLKAYGDGQWPQELFPTWTTSDPRNAIVEPRDGRFFLRGLLPGPVTLIAQLELGQTVEKPFTILDPEKPQWVRFELLQEGHSAGRCCFGLEAQYAKDYRRQMAAHPTLTWTTSDPALARWESPGMLAVLGDGDVTVTVAGMGMERSIPLHLRGGVAFRLDSLFSFDKCMARGIRYFAAVSVQGTDQRLYRSRAPGLDLEVEPKGILSFEQTGETSTMTARQVGKAKVTARLGAQRLEAEVEVIEDTLELMPISIHGDTFKVGDLLRTFTDRELELSVLLRSSNGLLDGGLNLEWSSSAPSVLELVQRPFSVARAVAPGRATLRAECKARGLSRELTLEVVDAPEIQWF
jgi:hypothetical protein